MSQTPPDYGAPIRLDAAKKVLAAAEVEARKIGVNVTITVVDSGGHMVHMQRMDGSPLASIAIAEAKASTALKLKRATKMLQDAVASGGEHLRLLSAPGIVVMEGGELLLAGNSIVGAIGVSGATSAQDAQIGRAGGAVLG